MDYDREAVELYSRSDYSAFFKRAASIPNDVVAQALVARCHFKGMGVAWNPEKGCALLEPIKEKIWSSSLQGIGIVEFLCGLQFDGGWGKKNDFSLAVYWYEKAAAHDCLLAMNNLGMKYFKGDGVAVDFKIAFAWLKKAADKGCALAACNLGRMYSLGRGVERDLSLATMWFRVSATGNNSLGQLMLAKLFYSGKGVEENRDLALFWGARAAGNNSRSACYWLGEVYSTGDDDLRDLQKGVAWFERAANLGSIRAWNRLGDIYEQGSVMNKDLVRAKLCREKAAALGRVLERASATEVHDLHLTRLKDGMIYHMTDVANLEGILLHGIQSKHRAVQMGLLRNDISDGEIQGHREVKLVNGCSLHEYASFYFNPRNAMLFRVSKYEERDVVVLGVSPRALEGFDYVVSDRNAAARSAHFGNTQDFVDGLQWDRVFADTWNVDDAEKDNIRQIMQSELLVLNSVAAEYIKVIYCRNSDVARRVRDICTKVARSVRIELDPNLFFDK